MRLRNPFKPVAEPIKLAPTIKTIYVKENMPVKTQEEETLYCNFLEAIVSLENCEMTRCPYLREKICSAPKKPNAWDF